MKILGIDPGLDGALCLLEANTGGAACTTCELVMHDMPTLRPKKKRVVDEVELARLIDAAGHIDVAVVERVGVRPGEGASGAFSFGMGYGLLLGILRAHFITVMLVTPQTWKRGVGLPAGATKDASRQMAKDRFQREAGLFVRVKDNGRAEAALIAAWGVQRVEVGK